MYEEKSLGVFDDDVSSIDEEGFTPTGSRATIWSRYLAMHMRKQLSFGEYPDSSCDRRHHSRCTRRYVVARIGLIRGVYYRGEYFVVYSANDFDTFDCSEVIWTMQTTTVGLISSPFVSGL